MDSARGNSHPSSCMLDVVISEIKLMQSGSCDTKNEEERLAKMMVDEMLGRRPSRGSCWQTQLPQTHASAPFHANLINSGSLGARTSPAGCRVETATIQKSALETPAVLCQSLEKDQHGLRRRDTPLSATLPSQPSATKRSRRRIA
jgi:hypothetical protein